MDSISDTQIASASHHGIGFDRRSAIQHAGAALVGVSGLSTAAWGRAMPVDRLAMTTVCLRNRIPIGGRAIAGGPVLPLEDAFRFVRGTFGLRNVELWSLQFPDVSDAYCSMLRARATQAGCRICNIQVDGPYDLSNPDGEVRSRSMEFAMAWIRRAAIMGSPSIRINTDAGNAADRLVPDTLVPIYRALGDYGQTLGVRILIGNHIGCGRSIDVVVGLLARIDHANVRGLADWDHSNAPDFAHQLADLARLSPWLDLVSAKGQHFTPSGEHVEYPISPIVAATERSGFRGLYSIELYTEHDQPDPIFGVRAMIHAINQFPV